MAQKVSINYTTRAQDDSKSTKSITNVNPAATGDQLLAFTQGLVGLTSDFYVDADRIDRQSLSDMKPAAPVSLGAATYSVEGNTYIVQINVPSQNDFPKDIIFLVGASKPNERGKCDVWCYANQSVFEIGLESDSSSDDGAEQGDTVRIILTTTENAQYASTTVTKDIIWGESSNG